MKTVHAILCAVLLALSTAPALAQYPTKQINLIVAYAAGGTGDTMARLISDRLGAALGQTVIVENRAGASGAIGSRAVTNATPDGHTLLLGQTGEMSINQHWLKDIGYDPDKDLQPVALVGIVPLALVVPVNAPYSTMAEYWAFLKSNKISTFASAGNGTPGYFAGEYLKASAKSPMTHVPYKGAGPALNDLIGGHVDMYFPGFAAVAPLMTTGKLKLLAVSSATRSPAAPQIPTVAEATGIKNFDFTLWGGVFAPRNTPKEVVERLNAEINKILQSPETARRFAEVGADIKVGSVEDFTKFVRAESQKYIEVIKTTGAKPE
ncbi:MAG: tripartite tricarboxylate transporter substrate binding protein [Pseudolabrys sp.]|nr:tripartite tricarboxylate transporter substrate binding protein [Pseudolabrys sp.]MBV9954622.1 tripartite tricarboxylate transporter substrate binding protein [Pseudolabrys sp.]